MQPVLSFLRYFGRQRSLKFIGYQIEAHILKKWEKGDAFRRTVRFNRSFLNLNTHAMFRNKTFAKTVSTFILEIGFIA